MLDTPSKRAGKRESDSGPDLVITGSTGFSPAVQTGRVRKNKKQKLVTTPITTAQATQAFPYAFPYTPSKAPSDTQPHTAATQARTHPPGAQLRTVVMQARTSATPARAQGRNDFLQQAV